MIVVPKGIQTKCSLFHEHDVEYYKKQNLTTIGFPERYLYCC